MAHYLLYKQQQNNNIVFSDESISEMWPLCHCRTAAHSFHLLCDHFCVHPFLTCIPSACRHMLRVSLSSFFWKKPHLLISCSAQAHASWLSCLLAAISPQWISSILTPDLLTLPSPSLLFPHFFYAHLAHSFIFCIILSLKPSSTLSSPLLFCNFFLSLPGFCSLSPLSLYLSQEPVWLQCDLFSDTAAAAAAWHGWELA